jgi:predicted LPLAT superfamily acyltransferase
MPLWQGKSRGNKLGYAIFIGILKRAGVKPAYLLLRFVTLYYYFFSKASSRNIISFFGRLGFSKKQSAKMLYRNYYLFGQSIIDKFVLMSGIPNSFTFDFDGEENLRHITSLNKGGLLLSAHIGNWEIAGHLLKRLNTQINIVMYDGEREDIKAYLETVTGERTAKIIFIRQDLSHIYEISEALRNNELVCMHADRFMEGNKTVSVPFLGQEARFPAGPFILASSFRVPVSFVFALKESPLHYHFYASEAKYYPESDKQAFIRAVVDDFTGSMEKKVKQYPEQWYNYYNFWQQ